MWFLVLSCFASLRIAAGNFNFSVVMNESVTAMQIAQLYIPTVRSQNEKCKNDSLFYLEELKKFTLWATEMFDSTAKFPSGMLYGSTYEFGNFDECTEVKVPDRFQGKYCLTKFKVTPPHYIRIHDNINFENERYEKYYNISAWEKVAAFSQVDARSARDEVYFSFCLPSSCTSEDLKTVLKDFIESYNKAHDFEVQVDVNERNCQVEFDFFGRLTTADIVFIVVALLPVVTVLVGSIYDLMLKLGDFENIRIRGKLHDVFMCFSLPANIKRLASGSKSEEGLACMGGLKVFSMFLIIMGHRCMFMLGSPLINPIIVEKMYTRVEASVLLNGPIIVDTFFVISGFLAVYLILLKLDKTKGRINMPLVYLHRFIRLYPPYLVVLAFYSTIFAKIGSGPVWQERLGLEQERCSNNWWTNVLFINNYVNSDQMCLFQSWYLDCDVHFFLVTPVIAWLLWKKPSVGLTSVFVIIFASIFASFAVVYVNNSDAILLLYAKSMKDLVSNITFNTIYIPSHMRATPYFVGVAAGYLKYHMKTTGKKIPKYGVYLGWTMGVFISMATIYTGFIFYVQNASKHAIFAAFYAGMHHFTWSICMSWVIIAVSSGYGAWLDAILSWPALVMFSRITYTAFLVHVAVQIFTTATIRTPIYISVFQVVYQTLGDIAASYFLGFVLSMFYEAPIIQLEKIIFKRGFSDKDTGNGEERSLEQAANRM